MSIETRASASRRAGPAIRDDQIPVPSVPGAGLRSNLLATLPLACALHCLATPLLVAFLPFLAIPPSIEWILLLASMTVATLALVRGGKVHRHRGVWALAAAGTAIWAASLLGIFEPLPEVLTAPIGGILLGAGLLWNGRLLHRRSCIECGCPLH